MRFDLLKQAVQAEIERGRLPGAVMLVQQHGRTILSEALGRRDPLVDEAMSMDAIFRIYSMTKPIVSLVVLRLVEQGRIGLDDAATRYFPEFNDLTVGVEVRDADGVSRLERRPATHAMTIRDLLRHTSGLTYGLFEKSLVKDEYLKSGVEGRDLTNQTLIEKLGQLPLAYEPGTTWEYSRSTDVLGALIERVTGTTLGDYLREQVFAPLGMVDTGFWTPAEQLHRLAQPHGVDPDSGARVKLLNPAHVPTFESGGGGLVSTAADYLRFQQLMLAGGALDGVRLVTPDTIALMTRDHLGAIARGAFYLPGPDYGFGLGVAVRAADGEYGHRGDYFWGGLAGTFQWIDPAIGLSAILLIQAPNQRDEFRTLFRQHVYRALNG